jgi:hypothetical protein
MKCKEGTLAHMIAAGVVAVALMISSHGEGTRESKFQGALLAQADLAPAPSAELAQLIRARPSMTPSIVVLATGGGISVLALGFLSMAFIAGGEGVVLLLATALLVGVGGLVVGTVGGIMMIVAGLAQREADVHIHELEHRAGVEPAGAVTPPMQVMAGPLSTLLLARF